jgi:hypothetical protein
MATTYAIHLSDGWRINVQDRRVPTLPGRRPGGCVAVIRDGGGSLVKSFANPTEGSVTSSATAWLGQHCPQALGLDQGHSAAEQSGPSCWDAWDPGDGGGWTATPDVDPVSAARTAYQVAFQLLELHGVTTGEQLTAAFHRKAREHHPDAGGDAKQFHRIKTAYDLLRGHLVRRNSKQLPSETPPPTSIEPEQSVWDQRE